MSTTEFWSSHKAPVITFFDGIVQKTKTEVKNIQ
jgi:hypothetical protein